METDRERSHRSTNSNSTSELFVCFTSRLSSSSMKLSSKSILSPSRSRDPPQISLSSSLSRRLKTNGSIKGGQASPMFPTATTGGGGGGKRRGCGFDNPEPSSPKVTCIGQVRVKTKKQGKKMRARSKRRTTEPSFRKGTEQQQQQQQQQLSGNLNLNLNLNPADLTRQSSQGFQHHQRCLKHRNQRWVHLPLTICEALREFSCFFPCRSSCMSSEKEKEKGGGGGVEGHHGMREVNNNGNSNNNNNAVGRWLVALQDAGDGKGRGIELVMEEEMMEVSGRERSHSQRRHVFEDIDVDLVVGEEEAEKKLHEEVVGGEDDEKAARVSICIPPKNALLLMRCRSDPVKMAALANRFWESPVHKDNKCQLELEQQHDGEDDEEEEEEEEEEESGDEREKEQHIKVIEDEQEEEKAERETKEDSICDRGTEIAVVATEDDEVQDEKESYEIESRENLESKEFTEVKEEEEKGGDEEEEEANGNAVDKGKTLTHPEAHSDLENLETEEEKEGNLEERENIESSELSSTPETFTASQENEEAEPETEPVTMETSEGSTEEEEEKVVTESDSQSQQADPTQYRNTNPEYKERENGSKREEREREALPECLLLMMCEPKLSMEVSKETWVCSTDFIRWLPERPAGGGGGKRVAGETLTKSKPKPKPSAPMMQPPRSSCSFPAVGGAAGVSMAAMIEQKLVGSKSGNNGYEPFVLTRCKSEPMRSSTKLAPEPCFWNNRKLEPHPPAAQLGVGAPAGVGF